MGNGFNRTGIHFFLAAEDFLIIGPGQRTGKFMDQECKQALLFLER